LCGSREGHRCAQNQGHSGQQTTKQNQFLTVEKLKKSGACVQARK
jgi:hypothetical protein